VLNVSAVRVVTSLTHVRGLLLRHILRTHCGLLCVSAEVYAYTTCKTHVRGFLLHKDNELRVACDIRDLVDVGRDRLAPHPHSRAVDGVSCLLVLYAPHHKALVRRYNVQRRSTFQ
jgi:hypothetical protein